MQRPERRAIEQTVVATGRVLAPARVGLGVLLQGIVEQVAVVEGQHVNAGDVLLTLQNDEMQALARQAKGSLGLAAARLRQVGSVDAKLAKEQLLRAEKELERAQQDHSRTQALAASGAVPTSQLLETETALARAREARETAAIRASAVTANGAESQLSLASVVNAQGALDYANIRLNFGKVVAPAAGVILTRQVEPGDVATPGKTLLVLSRDGQTRLLVQPDERALGIIALGQSAEASAEAFPRRHFPVTVDWVAPVVDPSRGTIDVKLLVPSPPEYLKPDMTVQVTIHAAKHADALVVPPELVFDLDSDQPYALCVRQGKVERADLSVGLRASRAVEILSGIRDDDWLLVPSGTVPPLGASVRARIQK